MARKTLLLSVTLLGCGLVALAWQRQANLSLQNELARRGALAAEHARLQSEQRRLQAIQITPEELAKRREERATLAALVIEIERARGQNAARLANRPDRAASAGADHPSLRDTALAASEWRNVGSKQAVDALETMLWASAQGDVDTLNNLLTISPTSVERATAVFNTLPAGLRSEVGSPEQLIAILVANAVPLGSAWVETQRDYPPGAQMWVHLTDADGTPREALLALHPSEAGWRLVVPDAAIARYLTGRTKKVGP